MNILYWLNLVLIDLMGKSTIEGPQLLSHCIFSWVPCLNFNHVIIMKDFHNVFFSMVIIKTQRNQMPKKLHFLIAYDVML